MSSKEQPQRPTAAIDSLKRQYEILKWCDKTEADIKLARENAIKAIQDALGENEIGTIDGKPAVSWIKSYPNKFDSKRFREDHPELWDEYKHPPKEAQRTFNLVKEK